MTLENFPGKICEKTAPRKKSYWKSIAVMFLILTAWGLDHVWQKQIQESLLNTLVEYKATEEPPFVLSKSSFVDDTSYSYIINSQVVVWCIQGRRVAVFNGQTSEMLEGRCSHLTKESDQ